MSGFSGAVARHYRPWAGFSVVGGGLAMLSAGLMPGLLEYALGAVLILAIAGGWLAAISGMAFRAFKQTRASEVLLQCAFVVLTPSILVLALPFILP